jgi:eukaryotic-like serine/threonine-protein kinase
MNVTVCPRCGRPIESDAPAGLCGSCLLVASAETLISGSTDDLATMTSAGLRNRASDGPALQPDMVWGPYRIERLLGRGGMGEVYQAQHLPSGRRIALKVLRSRLQSHDERARFLREGQLAASVSHPHTVYIFGSEEIDGTPVITMELLAGGTLKDRVVAGGPMRSADAVAAMLDVISGLDAAAAAGILHRDIKPSNCFVDRDGVVKIGDFGLSISTLARDVHHQLDISGFEGTPQFAPPEQLHGQPLDVRADIYAVGATLYYLLTGRPPFDAPDLHRLVGKVTSETAAPPRELRRDIPARLSALVMQCLAKAPADRPASYPALAEALRPFLARDDRPARLGTRTLAAVLDNWIIVGVPVSVATMLIADPLSSSPERTAAVATWAWMVNFVYYMAFEGLSGASLGKRLFGMRVVSSDGSTATWRQIAVRTAVFYVPSLLLALVTASGAMVNSPYGRVAAGMLLSLAVFFSTARQRNGWRALHDVVSGTSVVARPAVSARHGRTRHPAAAIGPADGAVRRYGPFVALDAAPRTAGSVLHAFDPVLRRPVWIELAASSAPPVDGARRDLTRTGRLHWLTGRRTAEESWDAYEAPDGAPWITVVAKSQWSQTKVQLLDLANELASAADDGTQPRLALDRLWVRDDGRIVLLDFAPPGASSSAPADLTPKQLLQAAASRVPRNPSTPDAMPLSARTLLDRLSGVSVPSLHEARAALQAMATAHDRVHWWRRALPGGLAAAPVALMLLLALLIIPALGRFGSSETSSMMNLLGALRSTKPAANNPMRQPEVRAAAEIAVAGRYAHLIRDESFWNAGVVRGLAPQYRAYAEDILTRHPQVSPGELASAEAVLKDSRERFRPVAGGAGGSPDAPRSEQVVVALGGVIMSALTALALALVIGASLFSSLLVPGGVVSRQLGLATITGSGREITRLRSAARAVVIWLPGMLWLTYLALSPKVQGFVPTPPRPITATLLTVGVLAIGLLWTIVRRRGPHDVLLATWVVAR